MAGLDGIQQEDRSHRAGLRPDRPEHLRLAARAAGDHQGPADLAERGAGRVRRPTTSFLLDGDVFDEELIADWIKAKIAGVLHGAQPAASVRGAVVL